MLKKLLITICVLFTCILGTNAKVYTVETLPVVTQGSEKFVCNPDGILSAATVSHICGVCQKLEDSTSIQILVIAVDSISPEDDYRFAEDVGNHYGVGAKKYNSGLVILLAKSMGAIRFVTGTGLEGDLPDAICKRIQYQVMVPAFKEKKWDEGMTAGVDAVYSRVSGTDSFGTWEDEEIELTTDDYLFLLLLFGCPLLIYLYFQWKKRRCPYCKGRMTLTDSKVYRRGFVTTTKDTYLCKKCGRQTVRTSSHSESATAGGVLGGLGSSGWGGGGGGFSGGGSSFGGGSFGGGGAGSRF